MFFKNLRVYRATSELPELEVIEEKLSNHPARMCSSLELSVSGFAKAGHSETLLHTVSGMTLVRLVKYERILPASVIKEEVGKKVASIEEKEQRKVYRKEKAQIKDDVISVLAPQSFQRSKSTYAAIDREAGFIYVDSFSAGAAEELLSLMREALGSLPVRPINAKSLFQTDATAWARESEAPEGFSIGSSFKLSDDTARINAKHYDIDSDGVTELLGEGMLVEQIELHWQDKLSFLIEESYAIKRLSFSDIIQGQASDDAGDDGDAGSYFDASFTLMMLTLREFIPELLNAFGGELLPE